MSEAMTSSAKIKVALKNSIININNILMHYSKISN